MNNQNLIVVYNTKNEQIADEFMHENPEYFLGFICLIIIIFILAKSIKK